MFVKFPIGKRHDIIIILFYLYHLQFDVLS